MVTEVESEQLTELNKLVDEIKQGQRVVFLPPGYSRFIAVNILLIASFITLFAPVVTIIGSGWEIGQKAAAQIIVILSTVLCIIPPAFLITRGKKKIRYWFVLLASALAFIAALIVVSGLMLDNSAIQGQAPLLYLSIIISSLVAYLAQSAPYQVLTHFYYLLHKK